MPLPDLGRMAAYKATMLIQETAAVSYFYRATQLSSHMEEVTY